MTSPRYETQGTAGMNSPADRDDETAEPREEEDAGGGDSGETFVRSFSKDRGRLDRFPGRMLHHPFAAQADTPEDSTEPQDEVSEEVRFPPSPPNEIEFTGEPFDASKDEPFDANQDESSTARKEEPFTSDVTGPTETNEVAEALIWRGESDNEPETDADADPAFTSGSDHVFERISGWEASQQKAATYRWIIRLFFLGILAVLAFLTYRKLTARPVDARGGANPLFVQELRNYRFGPPNSRWKQTDNRSGSDLVLERSGPEGRLWIESGEHDALMPLGKLADETRLVWQREDAGWVEDSSSHAVVCGEEALKLTAHFTQAQRTRAALVFWRQGLWYRISYEAPSADFDAIESECQLAIDQQFQFLRNRGSSRRSSEPDSTTFHGIAYEYSIRSPGNEWQIDAEMTADSRFADLKLRNASRTASLVVSPRPDATIDKLRDLYVRRQEKLFEDAISIERDEDLRIAGLPAKRLQASIEEENVVSRFLVTTFLQGDGIAYQIEAEVNAQDAAEVLPALAIAMETFQIGPAEPRKRKEPQTDNDGRSENHFRKAPDWLNPQ